MISRRRPEHPAVQQGLDELTGGQRRAARDLLVAATAAAGRPADVDRLRELVDRAPMHALPPAAVLHRVGGTVLRGLVGVDGVPASVRDRLEALRHSASLHHLLVTATLHRIGAALDAADLSWAVLKGPVVAGPLYPEVGDRTYGDLDLLIARRDYPAAMRILEGLGYEHEIRDWALAEQMLAGQVTMTSRAVDVDLHWHVHYSEEDRRPFAVEPEALLERRRRVAVSGIDVPTLDQVDTLLVLAFHAARSGGHRLVWLKDVERSLAVEHPDLDELVRRARGQRCAPPVGLILGRARTVLAADVPVEALHALTPAPLRAVERAVCRVCDPIQLNDRDTVTRAFTRSARSSTLTTAGAVPARALRRARRRLAPPPPNETDDPIEKASYLDAVVASGPPTRP